MRPLPILCLATACIALATPARAQDGAPSSIGEAFGKLFEGVNMRPTPPPPPDFVVQSRPAEVDYSPLATPGSGRQSKKKTASELKGLETELDGAAAANRGLGARVKTPDGGAPGAAKKRSSAEAPRNAASGNAARQN